MRPLQLESDDTSKTVEDIRRIMRYLDRDVLCDYFHPEAEDIDPLIVCGGVSVAAFNAYTEDDEGLPVRLRFLDLTDDGRLVIDDWPTNIHECTKGEFDCVFVSSCGRDVVGFRSAAERDGKPHRAPDIAYGPMHDTPNRTQPPRKSCMWEWITVAVEVGRTQTWESLSRAAEWWLGYEGIQYVVLLKVNARGRFVGYRVFDALSQSRRMGSSLPAPVQTGEVRYNETEEPECITLDTRRVLSIPVNCPLPDGVNECIRVDLQAIMGRVANCIE